MTLRRCLYLGGLLVSALLVSTASAEVTTLDSVLVVPNPYNISGRTFGPKSDVYGLERIRFTNLPEPVAGTPTKIRIYSSTFNLVTVIDHETGNDKLWDGRNSDNQYIVSGVYIYVVEHATLGTSHGKFVVIR